MSDPLSQYRQGYKPPPEPDVSMIIFALLGAGLCGVLLALYLLAWMDLLFV